MFNEFRDFIARGNAMDLAVGIIIGASFTAIINSLVNDLINPVIGIFTGGIDFLNLFFALSADTFASVAAAEAAGVAVFKYGSFITAVINFVIIAWVVFLLVRGINRLRAVRAKPVEVVAVPPPGPTQEQLLIEIRDALVAQRSVG